MISAESGDAPGAESGPEAPARARWSLLGGVGAAVLALDQLTKWWAVEVLDDDRTIDLVGSLRLRLAFNTGSAFSLAQGRGALISLLALVIVAVLVRSGRYATRPASAVATGLVVGGALGNLADRAFRAGEGFLGGGVVDFIDLQWWPVFNVADSAIVVGAILLFVLQAREPAGRSPRSG
ncbi:MAG TPA: signal peptidase II [Acidimicrobiales bacterium]